MPHVLLLVLLQHVVGMLLMLVVMVLLLHHMRVLLHMLKLLVRQLLLLKVLLIHVLQQGDRELQICLMSRLLGAESGLPITLWTTASTPKHHIDEKGLCRGAVLC